MSEFKKFSEYEQRTLKIISTTLSPQELEALHPEDLDALQGRILYYVIKYGFINRTTAYVAYKQTTSTRTRA